MTTATDFDLVRRGLPKLYHPTTARRIASRWVRLRDVRRDQRVANPGLNTTISANDEMFRWADPAGYFGTGHWAGRKINESLARFGPEEPRRILDLPCGYGRVLRHLRLMWPDAEVVASELAPGAVEFCQKQLGAVPLQSRDPLWEVDLGGPYDLIWSGSLLTHFNAEYFDATLRHFGHALTRQGLLIFTTLGRRAYEVLKGSDQYPAITRAIPYRYGLSDQDADRLLASTDATGFGFSHYPGETSDPYGLTVVFQGWVEDALSRANLRLLAFEDGGWVGHQDLWTVSAEGKDSSALS
jgi:SAM-dependent methyltransferase